MSYQEILLSILVTSIVALLPMLYLFFKVYVRRTDLSLEKQKIELEMFRKSLENSLYSTNEKMASNKERWEDVNHMIYEAAKRNIDVSSVTENSYLSSLSINRSEIEIDHNRAFLLAPINPRFENQVDIIKTACSDIGIDCETADEEFISGPILSVIIKKMLSANIVIAVIDGRNPNVFYELGLAHAFGKTVVMVSGGVEGIPFDIQSQRMVIVDWDDKDSIEKIRRSIAESMRWANKALQRTSR
ncbi:nucleoside 2-deoxyribosyltransferase [Shewanella electrodiphila]|uniref:Nucleoside 2-deoxyribosyltransferase n=1 Tax=Shewanella electrodiphila TaxID=934143 RepID=A0ABT0KUE0_9GAMM|nr:nucleoside 2-deoxyribosyltransferase [Shewanella electrodiphila]MCL1047289.1 nucleoside 2-deoxyribosyltransferase [Shewanella electrodiphila]